MKMKFHILIPCFIILSINLGAVFSQSENLTRFHHHKDDSHHISLSGFSSGGTFAQQLQFSYPELFGGIAVFSHSHYRCGLPNGNIQDYDRLCLSSGDGLYSTDLVHDDIADYFKRDLIGDPKLLKDKKLYIYTGLRNVFFSPNQSMSALRVYERYIDNPEAIRTRIQDAPFVMPTNNNFGPSCSSDMIFLSSSFFIGNCGFSGAYESLNFILGERVCNKPQANQSIALEELVEFDQEEFFQDLVSEKHQMDSTGYYYIPKNCSGVNHNCMVHFFFHGCRAGREFAGDKHVANSGFLEVAELNNIIMVFPQTKSTPQENNSGCWDVFGVSGPLAATKEGVQVKIVKRMIDRVLGHRPADYYTSDSNEAEELLQYSTAKAEDKIKMPEEQEIIS